MKTIFLASAALLLAMPAITPASAQGAGPQPLGPGLGPNGERPGISAPRVNPAPTIAPAPTAAELANRPPRAPGISTAVAIEGAIEANRTCLGNTYKTTAMVADSAGVPIVVISNDGAAAVTQRIAMTKIQAAMKYHMASGEVADKAKTDAALAAEIKANPLIETARQGAVPIMKGSDTIGFFAVSGAPGGDKDEVCVRAGLAKIAGKY